MEVHDGKAVLYGCGDLVNDYEGIDGFEEYRGELRLVYLVRLDVGSGELVDLTMVPFQRTGSVSGVPHGRTPAGSRVC